MLLNTYILPLNQTTLDKLKRELKIETVSQFMANDPKIIADVATISLEQVMEIRYEVFIMLSEFFSEIDFLRMELLMRFPEEVSLSVVQFIPALRAQSTIKTEVECLDQLLGPNGFQSRQIMEIYGHSGTGKTQLALTFVANALSKRNK